MSLALRVRASSWASRRAGREAGEKSEAHSIRLMVMRSSCSWRPRDSARQPRGALFFAAHGENDAQAHGAETHVEDGLIANQSDMSALLRERLENKPADLLVEG